jgi:hypothetical protein
MPLIYRHRSPSLTSLSSSSSASSDTNADTAQPTDADDSIVLSDLVRTGEASRLRRRGAIALNRDGHNRLRSGRGGRQRPQREPSWGGARSDWNDDRDAWGEGPHWQDRGLDDAAWGWPRTADEEEDDKDKPFLGYFNLYCGGKEDHIPSTWTSKSFEPSILPLDSLSKSTPKQPSRPRTNGCGALLTTHATLSPHGHVWNSIVASSPVVVPLDAEFFDNLPKFPLDVRMTRCGCRKEGIGCAVW